MFVPVILGTAREGRQSEKAAKFVHRTVLEFGLDSEIIDVRDFRISATDNTQTSQAAKKLSEKVSKADGFVIVSPEYNHGYPGELKMMLDLAYQQYFYKPVGLCGVSSGPLGGARMVEQMRLVCVELHMAPIREAVYFPKVQDLFSEAGEIRDGAYSDRVRTMLKELVWYAEALKDAREKKKKVRNDG